MTPEQLRPIMELTTRIHCNLCMKTLDPNDQDPILRSFVRCTQCGRIFHDHCCTKYPRCSVCDNSQFETVDLMGSFPPLTLSTRQPVDIRDELVHQVQMRPRIPIMYLAGGGVLATISLLSVVLLILAGNPNSSTVRIVMFATATPNRPIPTRNDGITSSQIPASTRTTVPTQTPLPPQTEQPTQPPRASATRRVQPTSTTRTSLTLNGVVTANRLNLRSGPGPEYSDLGTLNRGASVTLVGRNADGTWGQLNNSEWVNLRFVSLNGNVDRLPVTVNEVGGWGTAGAFTGVRGRAEDVLRIRGGPGVNYMQLNNPDTIRDGTIMDIVGRSADGNWYQINVNGRSGWINANYTTITQGNVNSVPVVG